MELTLIGLREAERFVEVKIQALKEKVDRGIDAELERLKAAIEPRLGSSIPRGALTIDWDSKSLYLKFRYGRVKTARDFHNPSAGKRFRDQPFQDVLASQGYIDIEPDRGQAIEVSHGEAPGVRIKAKMTPEVIERILRGG